MNTIRPDRFSKPVRSPDRRYLFDFEDGDSRIIDIYFPDSNSLLMTWEYSCDNDNVDQKSAEEALYRRVN